MVIAFKGLASCFLCFSNKGFRIPSNQLKLAYVERIEKLARANGYCVRRHSNEQGSLRVKRHMVTEASRLLGPAELLAVPAAKRDAMSAKCLATSRGTQSKILQACRSLIWPAGVAQPVRLVVATAGQIGTIRSAMSSVERRCATITREIGRRRMASLIARSFSSSRWLVASSSSRMRGAR
jgi:hypothetical protein